MNLLHEIRAEATKKGIAPERIRASMDLLKNENTTVQALVLSYFKAKQNI